MGSIRARSRWSQARPCAPACATPPRLRRCRPCCLSLLLLDDPRAQHYARAVVVQLEREDEDIPYPPRILLWQMRQSAELAVNVGLARLGYGADDLAPFAIHFAELFEEVAPGEPYPLLFV